MSSERFVSYESKSENPLLVLSVVFLVLALLQVFVADDSILGASLEIANWVIWAIFVIDYALRLYGASDKWKWIRSHPLELAIVALPLLRPLRLLRLIPVLLKLFKEGKISLASRTLTLVSGGLFLVTIPAALALYQIESGQNGSPIKTGGDAMWWAITTITTVGYGDMYPVTAAGRLISVFVIIIGISFVGVLTAAFASWFVEQADNDLADKNDVSALLQRLTDLENQIKDLSKYQSENK